MTSSSQVAWEDETTRTALTKEWRRSASKNKMCQGHERTKNTEGEEAAEGEGEGVEEKVPDIKLHGDHYDDMLLVVPVENGSS